MKDQRLSKRSAIAGNGPNDAVTSFGAIVSFFSYYSVFSILTDLRRFCLSN